MPTITCIDDLKRIYERRVPRMFYDYCESGSWTEQTFRENSSDFEKLRLRQRIAVDMTGRSTATQMIGQDVAMPVALAPVGLTGMQHADGEIKAARAAEEFGVPFTLSTMSINSIEEVAEATSKPFWFQLYTMKDTDFTARLIQRAKDAGCSALVITLDLQILGQRHKDLKNGLSAPPKLTPSTIANLATKWAWGLEMLTAKRRNFGNIVGHVQGITDTSQLGAWTAEQFDPALDWGKIEKLMELWGGKVILKGILDEEDAKMAAKLGCGRNHGFEPWRTPARRRAVVDSHAAPGAGRSRRRCGGASRQRHPLRSGRAESHRHGRQGHHDRSFFCLWSGRYGPERCVCRAGSHPQGTRYVHGAVRRNAGD